MHAFLTPAYVLCYRVHFLQGHRSTFTFHVRLPINERNRAGSLKHRCFYRIVAQPGERRSMPCFLTLKAEYGSFLQSCSDSKQPHVTTIHNTILPYSTGNCRQITAKPCRFSFRGAQGVRRRSEARRADQDTFHQPQTCERLIQTISMVTNSCGHVCHLVTLCRKVSSRRPSVARPIHNTTSMKRCGSSEVTISNTTSI